jgi:Tol biopolymer transport system component
MKKSLSIHFLLALYVLLTSLSLSCGTKSTRSEDEKWDVVFLSDRAGITGLFTMKSDGTDQKRLGETWAIHLRGRDPLWSPDKSKIAFVQAAKSNSWIMTIDSDGSHLDTLVREPGYCFARLGDWSPDGGKLVYYLESEGDTSKSGAYVINPDGSGKMRLDQGWEPRFCGNDRIVYAKDDGIYIIGIDGEDRLQLQQVFFEYGLHNPVGSSDGKKVAFYRTYVTPPPYQQCWLEIMNSDGSGHNTLVRIDGLSGFAEIELSPDDKRILFLTDNGTNSDIHVTGVDGSKPQALIIGDAVAQGGARWSPDGREIIFTSEKDGNREIYTANASAAGTARRLTNNPADDSNPDW